jgi:6-phosphogluconolactonase
MTSSSGTSSRSALWLGAYTPDSGEQGHATGISRLALGADGAITQAEHAVTADSPSFLATHPALPVLYAIEEFAQRVVAYRVNDDGTLEQLGDAFPAGAAVCHIAVSPDGRFAVATCWGDGRVLSYQLDERGALVARAEAQPSVDPHADAAQAAGQGGRIGTGGPTERGGPARREAAGGGATGKVPRQSRAHSSLFLPDGRILSTDLGHDTVRIWHAPADPGGALVLAGEIELPFGSGPRHMALHPSGHVYVITEYSVEVLVLAPGTLQPVSASSALAAGAHDGDAGAHITFDGDGHVHTTVRSANAIGVLEVADAGARLVPVVDVPCGGNWPRHHLQLADRLYVANQISDDIAVFRLGGDGVPVLEATVPAGTPTCLVPAA